MISTSAFAQRVKALSATLGDIEYTIQEPMVEEAEDYCSYNGSYYCEGWIKPIFDAQYKCAQLECAEDLQVIRLYALHVNMEGLAYDEIPEDWDDDNAPDMPELEVIGAHEYRQIWMSQTEVCCIDIADVDLYDEGCANIKVLGMQDWAYEPKHKTYLRSILTAHSYMRLPMCATLDYYLSPLGELLGKHNIVMLNYIADCNDNSTHNVLYRALKVAVRHNYALPTNDNDCRIYLDYLYMLEGMGVCMTEPRYICPNDYHAEHDRLATMRTQIEQQRQLREALAKEQEFEREHSWLFGISFETDHFVFTSLDSIDAYRQEGEIMHHCIFRCGYYNKHNMLAMHIADKEGNRVATCTIDLVARKIEQIQPMCNAHGYDSTHAVPWRQCKDYIEIHNNLCARMHTFPYKPKQQQKEYNNTIRVNIA